LCSDRPVLVERGCCASRIIGREAGCDDYDPMTVHGRPRFAKLSVHGDMKVRLHPYIRTFAAASPLSLMGFAGQLLYRFVALKVLRTFWASLTTV